MLAILACWAAPANMASAAERPPNIVFILADDLGYGDLGCYGQKKIATPHIDRLAREGMRFTQAYAGSSVCAPSRCCLMTGLHNGHGRVRDNIPHGVFLRPDDVTVAEVLKQAGYQTGAIGKWSLGETGSWGVPNLQGFDYFYGHRNQDQAHFYYPHYLWENDKVVLLRGNRGGQLGDYTHDLFTAKGLDFIRRHQDRPFFLYLAYTVPHFSDYPRKTPEHFIVPSDAPYGDRDWPQQAKNYAAMISRLDGDVGRIAALIDALGLSENTLIVFSSDNGPYQGVPTPIEFFDSNGALRGGKRDLYEGGVRVPLIARWPGHVPRGAVSDHVVAFWDMLPTLAELAGLAPPKELDGLSMAAVLAGRPGPEHEYLYWDYGHTRARYLQAVRRGKWKGVRNGLDAPLELYDLERDAAEREDLAKSHGDVVKELLDVMNRAMRPSDAYPSAGRP
ncbi:MAG: arylsulfatase [Pirellulaceae bacterium]